MEVSALARGVLLPRLNPYPAHYRRAFAFSIIPYPTPHGLALRLAVPIRESAGLTTFSMDAIP